MMRSDVLNSHVYPMIMEITATKKYFNLAFLFYGQKKIRTNQVTNMNKYRQVQTDIEVSTPAGRVCHVFGYEPHDALIRLTEQRCETRNLILIRALRSLSKNLLC